MAEGSPKDGNASKEADSSNEGGLWSGIKSLLFGENAETSLRQELEEALDEYDEEDEEEGDVSYDFNMAILSIDLKAA